MHDAMNLFDEIDEYDNMALEEQEYEDIMMRSFVDIDPVEDVTTLSVGFGGDVRPPNTPNDWGSLGRAIGANTQLRELSLRQLVAKLTIDYATAYRRMNMNWRVSSQAWP